MQNGQMWARTYATICSRVRDGWTPSQHQQKLPQARHSTQSIKVFSSLFWRKYQLHCTSNSKLGPVGRGRPNSARTCVWNKWMVYMMRCTTIFVTDSYSAQWLYECLPLHASAAIVWQILLQNSMNGPHECELPHSISLIFIFGRALID